MFFLKKIYRRYKLNYLRQHPLLWMYSAYLTLRYVDDFKQFPAFFFTRFIPIKINKHKNAQIIIENQLLIEPWLGGHGAIKINLFDSGRLLINGDFILGNNITILVAENATLLFKGKAFESGSGITANSVVMVDNYLEIGNDCIIAWDTYLTDSDWHQVEGKNRTSPTYIGDHVWIGVGVKVMKGVKIGDNSIVTSNSVVLNGEYPEKSMISGIPAKVIKSSISNWKR